MPNDPTVLFTPAGMNQFKREFMGLGDPSFTRATTCQKCIRTGDIENVGKTAFHETFFEMLGNFSFGDYFKREAIHWAWEFLTKTLKIPADRLTVTVYLDDDEAYNIWHDEIKRPRRPDHPDGRGRQLLARRRPDARPQRRLRPLLGDLLPRRRARRKSRSGTWSSPSSTASGPGQLEPLPKKNIDTGMGLERAAACLQGVPIDLRDRHLPADRRRRRRAARRDLRAATSPDGIRIRRMADHARALTFCIHENVRPSNEKQGYVVRRLLRRAVLDAYQMGRREPFLYQLVPAVAEVMARPYPELRESVPRIQTVIREEEEQFLRNLENGLKLLERHLPEDQGGGLRHRSPGEDAFDLHSTYGIPVEVTESLAADQNLRVDMAGLRSRAMDEHADDLARHDRGRRRLRRPARSTRSRKSYHHGSEFLGYATTEPRRTVIGILEQNRLADSATVGQRRRPADRPRPRPDPVLRRERRPGRRHRRRSGARGSSSRSTTRRRRTTSRSTSAG